MIKQFLSKLLPRAIGASVRNYRILSIDFGQYKTIRDWECIDRDEAPIPWYTYPALEYIKQLDFSEKTLFEHGSGNFTLFWAQRCKQLVSVEDNRKWYDKVRLKLPDAVAYHLCEEQDAYITSIARHPDKFDLIIVDGSHRYDCAKAAIRHVKEDGLIILDNSDWFEKTSALLRASDFIEVDMAGFGPINGYTWTTSFYFTRNVSLKPAHPRQPMHGVGSLPHSEEGS